MHRGTEARPLKRPRQSAGWPRQPTDIDNEVVALGGTTHALDLTDATIQSQKAPVSKEKRLEELVRDSGRLRHELDYWKGVAVKGSTFIANVDEAVAQLTDTVSRLKVVIDEINSLAAEKSMCHGNPSKSDLNSTIERQTGHVQVLPLMRSDVDVLLTPVRRGREGYDFEVVDSKKIRKEKSHNPGGWF
ncbi:uncharacterized protein CTRU02_212492 [Colletotrichum truncatum]|uniref:Uncharacterized protein n=2 Tax=Colletotrichum truncatum TaxID=5467 RepID=A0ACC3YEL6_COLTU|nr:uncharacterized protein CTRU02_13539 [Colletotrichum truncatum]XP_036584625.1 uncharacterized protein CTRU02_05700 [Colletotrichum truncatum]KAF6783303.1 hypothetical protein CTRU02_13539 [Colletotrichum truncatum]KAF6794143.1 hypothetical protein CTRU02_05700 [Colletotrichum truncatum]